MKNFVKGFAGVLSGLVFIGVFYCINAQNNKVLSEVDKVNFKVDNLVEYQSSCDNALSRIEKKLD